MDRTTQAALQAIARGFQVIALHPRLKRPVGDGWQNKTWPNGKDTTEAEVEKYFKSKGHDPSDPATTLNIGTLLGLVSGDLLDVDLDHARTSRLKEYFLPPTPAMGGRAAKPRSHYWYIAKPGTLPGYREHLMPPIEEQIPNGGTVERQGAVIVELRSSGGQTALPPSIHPSGESYRWTRDPWGGDQGPAVVDGRVLATQVALLALGTVLIEYWPSSGTRHDAYLALAGGLLRMGDGSVHPFWERNAATLISAMADAMNDEDGADMRVGESVGPTIKALQAGKPVVGYGRLGEILTERVAKHVRHLVGEVERAAGVTVTSQASLGLLPPATVTLDQIKDAQKAKVADKAPAERTPLENREWSWDFVDMSPYLSGTVKQIVPTVFRRSDSTPDAPKYLFYPGRVNMLYGSSESAKSWLALYICMQEMVATGSKVVYVDLEDEPVNTLGRLILMGADPKMLETRFAYVHPEDSLASMERDRWGNLRPTESGLTREKRFREALDSHEADLIVVDGMTVLYGLHGLDANDGVSTDVITSWLKSLAAEYHATVILIDHTGKGSTPGSLPIGSQHKMAMVQGTMLQVWADSQPRPGAIGQLSLYVVKDRPGKVREISQANNSGGKSQLAAIVTLDSTDPVKSVMSVDPPLSTNQQSQQSMGIQVSDAVSDTAERLKLVMSYVIECFHGRNDTWLHPVDVTVPVIRRVADALERNIIKTAGLKGIGGVAKTRADIAGLVMVEIIKHMQTNGYMTLEQGPAAAKLTVGRGRPPKVFVLRHDYNQVKGWDDKDISSNVF